MSAKLGADLPPVSRRLRVKGASQAREGVQGLPQHEQGTFIIIFVRIS